MVGNAGVWGLSWISLGGVGAPGQPEVPRAGPVPGRRSCPWARVRAVGVPPAHAAGISCAGAAPLTTSAWAR